jgi:hypothetical protein
MALQMKKNGISKDFIGGYLSIFPLQYALFLHREIAK